jgi:hypothetical protein
MTRRPTLVDFLREARAYQPEARSPHFARLAALRAEILYGMPAEEAYKKITAGQKAATPQANNAKNDRAIVETMVELEGYEEGKSWIRGRDPVDVAFEELD